MFRTVCGLAVLAGAGWAAADALACPRYPVVPVWNGGCYTPAISPAVPPADDALQIYRKLVVKNDTKETIAVFVQYRTKSPSGQWTWYPAEPGAAEKPAEYEIARQ